MFIQADNIKKGSQLKTDICIIGAGAAGIAMALELDRTGLSVLILESGDFKVDNVWYPNYLEPLHRILSPNLFVFQAVIRIAPAI